MLNMLTLAVARIRTGLIDAVTPECNSRSHGDDINDEVTIAFRLVDIDQPDGGRRTVVSVYSRRISGTDASLRPLPRDSLRQPSHSQRPGDAAGNGPVVVMAPDAPARKAETAAAALWPAPPSPPPAATSGTAPRTPSWPEPTAPARTPAAAAHAPDRAAPPLRPAPHAPIVVSSLPTQGGGPHPASPPPKRQAAPAPRSAADIDVMLDDILDAAAGRRRAVPQVAPARSQPREIPVRRRPGGMPLVERSPLSRSLTEMGTGSDGVMGRDWRSCGPGFPRPHADTGLGHTIGDLGIGFQ